MLSLLSHNCSLETTKNANTYIAFFWSPLFLGWRMAPRKTHCVDIGKFWPYLKSRNSRLIDFCVLPVPWPVFSCCCCCCCCLLTGLGVTDLSFFLSVGSSGEEFFRVYGYSRLSNWKQHIGGLSLASISIFGRFFIALFVPLSRNCLGLGFNKNA